MKCWRTISSGERIPNWTSLILRIGAAEKANWVVDMARRLERGETNAGTDGEQRGIFEVPIIGMDYIMNVV